MRLPPMAVAAALPTFIITYPDTHPHAAPMPICFGAGAFETSLTHPLNVLSVSRLISVINNDQKFVKIALLKYDFNVIYNIDQGSNADSTK